MQGGGRVQVVVRVVGKGPDGGLWAVCSVCSVRWERGVGEGEYVWCSCRCYLARLGHDEVVARVYSL